MKRKDKNELIEWLFVLLVLVFLAPFIIVSWTAILCYTEPGDTFSCRALSAYQTVVLPDGTVLGKK